MKKVLIGSGIAATTLAAGLVFLTGEQNPERHQYAIQMKVSDKVPVYIRAHAPAHDTHVQLSFHLDESVIENYKGLYNGIRVKIDSMGFNEVYRINENEKVKKKLIPKQNMKPDGSYELEIVRNPWAEAYLIKQDGSEAKFAENNLALTDIFGRLPLGEKGSIRIEKGK